MVITIVTFGSVSGYKIKSQGDEIKAIKSKLFPEVPEHRLMTKEEVCLEITQHNAAQDYAVISIKNDVTEMKNLIKDRDKEMLSVIKSLERLATKIDERTHRRDGG